jgi:putative tricarboxylic transport membrane protein
LNTHEIIGGIVIFLFGAVTTLLSVRMPIGTFRKSGTGMFPLCLGILLTTLSALFLFKLFLKKRETHEKTDKAIEIPGSMKILIFFFGTVVLITFFLNPLGYPLSSFLLMLTLLRILGTKKWTLSLPLSFVTVCYFLFVQWLKIPLPKGWVGL